jgi:hypothetical protein
LTASSGSNIVLDNFNIIEVVMRTLVDIPKADKIRLGREAKKEGVSISEMLHQAIKTLKSMRQSKHSPLISQLKTLQGTWKKGDGLKWQKKMRSDWKR